MATGELTRVIVDTDFIADPRLSRTSEILLREGKGLMAWTFVDVTIDGATRNAIEVNLAAEREVILDAVRRAGLTVLENAEKVTR